MSAASYVAACDVSARMVLSCLFEPPRAVVSATMVLFLLVCRFSAHGQIWECGGLLGVAE